MDLRNSYEELVNSNVILLHSIHCRFIGLKMIVYEGIGDIHMEVAWAVDPIWALNHKRKFTGRGNTPARKIRCL